MKDRTLKWQKLAGMLGVVFSSLPIALPATATSQLASSRPSIFNEAPYNHNDISQATPSSPTQTPLPAQQLPSTTPSSPIQTPLPEQQQPPSTTVVLDRGKVSVRLVNHTGAKISYQVIGDTAPRSLQGKSDVTLKDLKTPTTITFRRDDGGLLKATGRSPMPGMLELTLDATTDLGIDKNSMQIQPTGDVFFN